MVEWTQYLFFRPVRLSSPKPTVRLGGGRKEVTSFRMPPVNRAYCRQARGGSYVGRILVKNLRISLSARYLLPATTV